MNSHIPWMMDRLHFLFTEDPSEDDWQNAFEQCDPRLAFTTDLCDACYTDVTAKRCEGNIHVVSKEDVAIGKLMLFLHDGECQCNEIPKGLSEFCLLDAIAASGSMTALRECIGYFRKHTSSTHGSCEERKGFKITSFPHHCLESKPEIKPTYLPTELMCNQSGDLGEDLTAFTSDQATSNPLFTPHAAKPQVGKRLLLSPNCGGGYGERKQFSDDTATDLTGDDTASQKHDCPNLSDSSKLACDCSLNQSEITSDCMSSLELQKEKEYNPLSQKMRYESESPCCDAIQEDTINTQANPPPAVCAQNSKPESLFLQSPMNDNVQSDTKVQSKIHQCHVPIYGDRECPFACCFPPSEVDYLRQHIDQATLLSMAVQALYYNHGSMMVCARALNVSTMSALVQLSGSLPITDALLYLYFLSIEDKESFSDASLEDLFLLHERTLPLEVSQLCQLAWSDQLPTLILPGSSHHLANRCELTQFPDREMYGKTARVKFRRGYHDNASLFKCIENGGCACCLPHSTYKQTQLVMPETAAAAAGNLNMVRVLTKALLSTQAPVNDKQASPSQGKEHPRSCSKTAQSTRRPGVSVGFVSQVEHFGESNIGFLLRHSLYGGCDDIVHYILDNMGYWSLSGEETMACLCMCMLMGRDDLFFLLNLRAGDETRLARACESGSPLMLAVSFGRSLLVNLLLARGANPFLENCYGFNAIEMAMDSNHKDSEMMAVRMLSAASGPIQDKSLIGSALVSKKLQVARYLIGQGMTTTYENERHRVYAKHSYVPQEVPLIQWWLRSYVLGRCDDVLEFLLNQGLNVNTRDPNTGSTPLHLAVQRMMDPLVVEMLIASGARLNVKDKHGLSPLFYTVQRNQMENFGTLLKNGASVYDTYSFFKSALETRRFQVVLFLLHAGYLPSPANLEQLVQLGPRVPEPVQVMISSVRSEPPSLPALCALSLRENLGDRLNSYLQTMGCPDAVRHFVQLEHLTERFFDGANWNKILSWDTPLI